MFRALLLEKDEAGFRCAVHSLDEARLPPGDVLIRVEHSTLNYKDALAITNAGPVVRSWPMVAGIDAAGTVLESSHPRWQPGDRVVHNGFGLGRDALGRPGRTRAGAGGRAGALAGSFHDRPGDGHRHGGLYRDAVRNGA